MKQLDIATFNQAAERLFGYDADEVIGQNAAVLLPERLLAEVIDQVQAFAMSGAASTQIRRARPAVRATQERGGVPAEIYVSKLAEADRTMFTAIIRDVTDRENMLTALRQTNQTLDAVVQSSPFAIVAINSARRVIAWNRAAERIFGLPPEKAVSQPFAAIETVIGGEIDHLVRRLLSGEMLHDLEIQHQSAGGTDWTCGYQGRRCASPTGVSEGPSASSRT